MLLIIQVLYKYIPIRIVKNYMKSIIRIGIRSANTSMHTIVIEIQFTSFEKYLNIKYKRKNNKFILCIN